MQKHKATWAWCESRYGDSTKGWTRGSHSEDIEPRWDSSTKVEGYWAVRPTNPKNWDSQIAFARVDSTDGTETWVVCEPLSSDGLSHRWQLLPLEEQDSYEKKVEEKRSRESEDAKAAAEDES